MPKNIRQRKKPLHNWAHSTYPEPRYWEGKYAYFIKAVLIVLSLVYLSAILSFFLLAKEKWIALGIIIILGLIAANPFRGLVLTVILGVFQKGISPLGFFNIPLFTVCFSITFIIWAFKHGIHLSKFKRTRLDVWAAAFFMLSISSTLFHIRIPSMQDIETIYPLLYLLSMLIVVGVFIISKELLHTRKHIRQILIASLITGIAVS